MFWRRRSLRRLSDLPPVLRRRILREAKALRDEELRIQRILDLPFRPRLVLVDEETAIIATSDERDRLEADDLPEGD